MKKAAQNKLFDETVDNPTVVAADKLIELYDERDEVENAIEDQEGRVISLMKKNDRKVFVHSGRRFILSTNEPKEKLRVKEEKHGDVNLSDAPSVQSSVPESASETEPEQQKDGKKRKFRKGTHTLPREKK